MKGLGQTEMRRWVSSGDFACVLTAYDLLVMKRSAITKDLRDPAVMRIKIIGDESISRQACIYAEYRLFAALSQVLDTNRVRNASLVLRRAKSRRHCDGVVCTVTVELNGGEVTRFRTFGEHPYGAINRAVERFRRSSAPARHDPSHGEMVAAE
jgi:hypothetical protein